MCLIWKIFLLIKVKTWTLLSGLWSLKSNTNTKNEIFIYLSQYTQLKKTTAFSEDQDGFVFVNTS